MSILALSLARALHVGDALAKFVLILLADRHNADNGDCFPSVSLLAHEGEMSTNTIAKKLQFLEAEGFIRCEPRLRDDRGRDTTQYDLLFVPVTTATRTTVTARRAVPHEDWRPDDATKAKIAARYPHHEIDFDALAIEFVNYSRGAGRSYARIESAFANSASRALERRSPTVARLGPQAAGQRRTSGGLAGAVRDMLDSTG